MNKPTVSLRSIIWILMLASTQVYAQESCVRGWFGSQCQYKCHCTNNNCDNNGDCRGGDLCVKGWFGPQCQYVDLTYNKNDGTTKPQFTDADDTTCNDDINQNNVTLILKRKFPITWLRLHFSNGAEKLQNINVVFSDSSHFYQCNNRRSALVDSRTVDIHCDVDGQVDRVIFTGAAVGYLCSIYVSGGRNVALKQSQVIQSSTYFEKIELVASNAVDGNTAWRGCTHTQPGVPNPFWNVTFTQISDVNRYMLYNRGGWNHFRLAGFVLTSFDQYNVQVFQHVDSKTSDGLPVYDITTATATSSIRRVNIIANNTDNILTLCEVEIYGDSHCPVGRYGRECEHTCSCPGNEPCLVSTGRCPSGCPKGFKGENCDQECESGYFGENCAWKCSSTCMGEQCNKVTGRCEARRSDENGDCNTTSSIDGKTVDSYDVRTDNNYDAKTVVSYDTKTAENHYVKTANNYCDTTPLIAAIVFLFVIVVLLVILAIKLVCSS